MIKFKALNCLAAEKSRSEIISDLSKFIKLVGIDLIRNENEISNGQFEIFYLF